MKSSQNFASRRAGWGDLLGLLFTLLVLVIAYKLARPAPGIIVNELPLARCDLQHQACHLTLPGEFSMEIRIPERPVKTNDAFTVVVTSKHAQLYPLHFLIRGIELEMRSGPATFETYGEGRYRVQIRLPLCTTNQMTWEGSVLLKAGGQFFKWPLIFITQTI